MAADPRPSAGSAVADADAVAIVPRPGASPVALSGAPRWLGTICPFLRAADGTWRSAVPTRDHRCWAAEPPASLPTATQQELCLTEAHGGCERFLRSHERRAAALAEDHIEVGRLQAARFGPFVSTVPVAVDARPVGTDHIGVASVTRRRVPALLVGGGVVLVGIAALAAILGGGRLLGIGGVVPSASPAPTLDAVLVASVEPRPTAVVVATPTSTAAVTPTPAVTRPAASLSSATPTPEPTATIQPTPSPEVARRYTVKEGDTVKSIASKFGLKPRDLRAVNDIGKEVKVGQRLRILARSMPEPEG